MRLACFVSALGIASLIDKSRPWLAPPWHHAASSPVRIAPLAAFEPLNTARSSTSSTFVAHAPAWFDPWTEEACRREFERVHARLQASRDESSPRSDA
jgi:hypothetical protein